MKITIILLFFCFLISHKLSAFQETEEELDLPLVKYGHNGFQFATADNKYELQIGGRLQFRYAYPGDQDPITFDDFNDERRNILKINRARLKIGGHAYQPWLKYYVEYELSASRLLDFRIMVEKWPWLSFKAGQWKTEYSRERSISSGEQQMLERSIINRPFTLDRQQGLSVYGHLDGGGVADFDYNLAILSGNGMGTIENDDVNLMYSGRLQWNFLGEGVQSSGSALDLPAKANASLAFAAASNTSQFTRFSSDGGGSLAGFEEGEPGQFTTRQWLIESAYQYKSFGWHSELHHKEVRNTVNNLSSFLNGGFIQGGYLINPKAATHQPKVEVAMRYAHYRPNRELVLEDEDEYTLAINCFFDQHLNKLSADLTFFDFESESVHFDASGWRFRVQYDISF